MLLNLAGIAAILSLPTLKTIAITALLLLQHGSCLQLSVRASILILSSGKNPGKTIPY